MAWQPVEVQVDMPMALVSLLSCLAVLVGCLAAHVGCLAARNCAAVQKL